MAFLDDGRVAIVLPAQAGVDRRRVVAVRTAAGAPRAGGGGPAHLLAAADGETCSPRRRGWTEATPGRPLITVVLPAQAGVDRKPARPTRRCARAPRAGGGGPPTSTPTPSPPVCSPRRRGWTAAMDARRLGVGVLPAQAGVDRAGP